MEEELQELRALVAQLKVDNERLRQEQAPVGPAPSATLSTSSAVPNASAPAAERLVFVPRDRKCPMFRGRSGIALVEWVEEVQACVRARHLSLADQAFFLFDHLEGEAREEIKYRPSVERGDPARIIAILQELYGCSESYVALQEAFFSRKQHEGETLLEFSLALMSLMERVPGVMGMNVIRKCYQELFVQHGLALFELSSVTQAPRPVTQALQKCHQVTTQTPPDLMGKVNVVSLPTGDTEVPSIIATVASQTALPTVQDQMEGLDLSSLSLEEQGQSWAGPKMCVGPDGQSTPGANQNVKKEKARKESPQLSARLDRLRSWKELERYGTTEISTSNCRCCRPVVAVLVIWWWHPPVLSCCVLGSGFFFTESVSVTCAR
ncbi:hypothetical protein N1851_015636 [Merluccius polli]|uniref:Uncharacterized protein n=1 Tax=Merluccius polli TaxID=89951 RepID=A0AA47MRS2_MERPO|nr:hypothetical protein N1851_015636 [Merluccius polli]